MSMWQQLTARGGPRRTLGVVPWSGGIQKLGLDGEQLLGNLDKGFAADVTVAAVSDAGTLLRRFALPPAKAAVTDRLVRQQVAALLPGMDAQLAIAWRRNPESGDVTVAAGPRAALRAASQAPDLRGCDLLVPFGLALDALVSHGMNRGDSPAAWAVHTPELAWLLCYAEGGLVAADSVGPGEAVDAVFADLIQSLEPGQRPTQMTWVGRAGQLPAAEPGLTHAAADGFGPRTGWTVAPEVDDGAGGWLAAGAALIGRQAHDAEGLEVDDAPEPAQGQTPSAAASAPRRRPRHGDQGPAVSVGRWAAVGLWLVGALVVWAWAVGSGGARQAAVVEELGLSQSAIPQLDQGLAVARYFETSGPSLLAVLDELGQKTKGWMLDEAIWERESGLTLRGNLNSADALAQLARTMSAMRTLTGVEVRRQEPAGNRKVSYTLKASPSRKYFGAFVEPFKAVTAPEPEDPGSAVTAAPQAPPEPEPEKDPAAVVDREPTPTAAPTSAAAQVEPADVKAESQASGPITSIDDQRVQALLEKYPALRGRAEQLAGQGVTISEAQFERMEKALESRGGNP